MLKVGLQLTKNPKKYSQLLAELKSNLQIKDVIEFIHIPDIDSLKNKIPRLDILVTYEISEEFFYYATEKLKWIHFGTAGIEKSLSPSILKSETIITNASGALST